MKEGSITMSECIQVLINEKENLPFIVYGIGSQDEQCRITRKNGYPLHQLIFSKKGTGILYTQQKSFTIKEGDYFYLPPNQSHQYESTCDLWSTQWLQFGGSQIEPILTTLKFHEITHLPVKNIHKMTAQFHQLESTLQGNNPLKNYIASGQLYEFLLFLYQNSILNLTTRNENPLLSLVLDYIDENYFKDLSLENLSTLVNITPQHLCKVFKEALSMRPFEYIIKRRLQEAKKLLIDTNLPIKTIALNVGYEDSSYFCMHFKRYEGVTASIYRGR